MKLIFTLFITLFVFTSCNEQEINSLRVINNRLEQKTKTLEDELKTQKEAYEAKLSEQQDIFIGKCVKEVIEPGFRAELQACQISNTQLVNANNQCQAALNDPALKHDSIGDGIGKAAGYGAAAYVGGKALKYILGGF